jgi:superfamily I DNA/RNA helicase
VRTAPAIAGKKAKASGAAQELLPVTVLERDDESLAELLIEHYNDGDSILLLYRKSSDKALFSDKLQALINADYALPTHSRRFKQLTYHSAKGLQADAVFLLGDCQHLTHSPHKNQLYRLAGLGNPGDTDAFDNAQKDEVLRLAYVAITRAVRHCYWYIDGSAKEGVNTTKASDRIPADKPFFEDRRGDGERP